MLSLMWALLLIGAMTAIGYLMATVCLPGATRLNRGSLSFPLGAGGLAWLVFLMGWAGVRITLATYAMAAATLVVGGLFVRVRLPGGGKRPGTAQDDGGRRSVELVTLLAAAAMGLVVLGGLSVARSYSTWDAMAIWSVKGYAIAREGSLWAASEWGSHGLSYPLQLPLLIGLFKLVTGDVLPGSKLLFSFYFVSMLLGIYLYLRRRTGAWTWGAVAALTVATIPLVLEHATIGYANLPLTTLMVLGTLTLISAEDPSKHRYLVAGGLLYGLAAWMRPEALILVLVGGVGLTVYRRLNSPHEQRTRTMWIPLAILGAPWLTFNLAHGVTGVFGDTMAVALASVGELKLNLSGAYQVVRFVAGQYASPEVWGFAAPLITVLTALHWRRVGPHGDPRSFSLFIMALAWGLPVLVFYYLLSFRGDLAYWLGTGIDRLLMPATVAGLLWALSMGLPATEAESEPE